MIREITTDDLRRMENKEGLILQDAAEICRNGRTASMIC